jgi:hypothetical protein
MSNALDALYQAHSGWRYIVILVAIVVFVKLLIGLVSNARWSQLDQRLGAAFPVVMDIQLLLGIILWVARQQWTIASPARTWEHPLTMLLAVAVAHITWTRVKKSSTDAGKFRTGTIGYALAGLLVALGVMRITGLL